MSDEDNVELDTENQSTEEVDNTEQVEETVADTETEDLKLKELNKKLYERAKKAEAEVKELKVKKPEVQPAKEGELSSKDLFALMEAKVPSQDVDEVVRASKLLGVSIPEALKDDFVKARLSTLSEQRKSAEVSNTSGSKRTATRMTDDAIVERAMKGEEVDPEALAIARTNLDLQKVKRA